MTDVMEYTPGSLSRMFESNTSSDTACKQTKLQVLFSQPTKLLLPTKQNLKKSLSNEGEDLNSFSNKKIRKPETEQLKNKESGSVFKREESLRNAETETSRKKKKNRNKSEEINAESLADQSSPKDKPAKTAREVNAENAFKRITGKSTAQVDATIQREMSENDRTVFVGNVSLSVQKKTILRLFRTCGKVETVRLRSAPVADLKLPKKAAVIKQQFHPSRQSANFYVVFESASDAKKALSLNGTELEGLHIRVDLAGCKKHDHQKSVFVGNIPFGAEEEALRKHFKICGEIGNVRIIRDGKTGAGKGFGYVTFADSSSVSLAISLNNRDFNGRQLRVQRSTEKPASQSLKPKKNKAVEKFVKTTWNQKSENQKSKTNEKNEDIETKANNKVQPSAEKGNRKFDAKKAVGERKRKELRKKKIKKRALDKKKQSIGQLLTK